MLLLQQDMHPAKGYAFRTGDKLACRHAFSKSFGLMREVEHWQCNIYAALLHASTSTKFRQTLVEAQCMTAAFSDGFELPDCLVCCLGIFQSTLHKELRRLSRKRGLASFRLKLQGTTECKAHLNTLRILDAQEAHLTICQQQPDAIITGRHCWNHVNPSACPGTP